MKKVIGTLVVLLLIIGSVFAQSSNNKTIILTAEDAVQLALKNNITIKQSQMDLEMAKLKNKYSWSSVSPSFSLSTGISGQKAGLLNAPDGPVIPGSRGQSTFADADPTLSWSLSGGITFNFTTSIATNVKAAKLSYEAGEISFETAKRNIELSIRKTFYSLLYFNENLELQKRNLETAKQTYESNLLKYNQGRLSEINLLTSQYSYESKIPSVTSLQNSYKTNIDNFKVLLGLDLDKQIELVGNLEAIAEIELDDTLEGISVDEIPSIKSLEKNLEVSENNLQAARFSAYGPSLSLRLSPGLSKGIEPSGDPTMSLSYSATLSIPLDGYMPWSNGALNVKSQMENLEKQKMNLEQNKKTSEINIRNSYNSLKMAKEQLKLYEKNEELVQKTYDMTLKSYSAGSTDLLTLQKAEDNLYQAKYNVTNQRYSIISAVLDLENTLGIEFGTLGKK